MEDYYTVRQVQEILKVDRVTIYRMLNDGRLKGIKIGQQWRFPRSQIERVLIGETETDSLPATSQADTTFPIHCLQTIQNLYSEISQFGAVVVDLNGLPLTHFSNPSRFCSLVTSSTTGERACRDCWKQAATSCTVEKHFTCPSGLTFVATPIFDRSGQVGALLTGQFYWEQPDQDEEAERIGSLAQQYDLDIETLRNAAREVQVVPEERSAQIESWVQSAVDAMHSILNERSGFIARLQQIADLTQIS